jgi:hypothetical protein
MNTDIRVKHYFSRERHECFTITLNSDKVLCIVCERGQDIAIRVEFVDPDIVGECVEACRRLITYFPDYAEQVECILGDFFTLAHTCTGNVLFATVLRELGQGVEA